MAENLYCPRCAKPFTADTSYCRTCGLSLDGVAKIVTGDAENAPVTVRRPNFNAIRYAVGIMILGLVIGLLNGMLRDFGLYPDRYGKAVFLAIIAISMLTMGSAFLFPTKKYKKRKSSDSLPAPDLREQLGTAPLAGQLSPADPDMNIIDFPAAAREPVMAEPGSITDRTTRNLE
jgi:hypothetical protein